MELMVSGENGFSSLKVYKHGILFRYVRWNKCISTFCIFPKRSINFLTHLFICSFVHSSTKYYSARNKRGHNLGENLQEGMILDVLSDAVVAATGGVFSGDTWYMRGQQAGMPEGLQRGCQPRERDRDPLVGKRELSKKSQSSSS